MRRLFRCHDVFTWKSWVYVYQLLHRHQRVQLYVIHERILYVEWGHFLIENWVVFHVVRYGYIVHVTNEGEQFMEEVIDGICKVTPLFVLEVRGRKEGLIFWQGFRNATINRAQKSGDLLKNNFDNCIVIFAFPLSVNVKNFFVKFQDCDYFCVMLILQHEF